MISCVWLRMSPKNYCRRTVRICFLSLWLLFTSAADEQRKLVHPLWCSYTKNIFCKCGPEENIFSLSINACRFDIYQRSCGECVSRQLASKVCEIFYSCHECGTSLEECRDCSTSKTSHICKESAPVGNYKKTSKQVSKRQSGEMCTKSCENGGRCDTRNVCICNNQYRGATCQYPVGLCSLEKTFSPSTWQCNHTHVNTVCRVACHPPGSLEAERNFQTHVCSVQGTWDPALPACVKGTVPCPDPGYIYNGRRESFAHYSFFPGTVVSFVCDHQYILHGESTLICLPSGKWSTEKPLCYQSKAFCPQPIVPENAEVILFMPGLSSHRGATDYGSGDIPVRLKQGFIPAAQESFDAPISPGSLPIGSRVQYKCSSRFYQLYGSEYQTCLSSGSWSGHQPTCIPRCGISDSPRYPFITNGNLTEKGQWPWQVGISVWFEEDKQWLLICGGSLLNERWVITAAHCVTREHSNTPLNPEGLTIFLGKYFRSFEKHDKYVQSRKIAQIVIHEDYDFTKYDADIALLQLHTPAELTSRVQPICLPSEESTRENIRDDKLGVVIGWGVTEEQRHSETLRQSVLPVVSDKRCEQGYRESLRSITVTKYMFCAGYEEGRVDTCSGDSGGPMMFLDEDQRPKRWILEGIVSWGSGYGCGKENHFAGFTKVKAFSSWVNMHI